MGILVNPDNLAFQVALNSEIYVDKSGLIKYTNKVLNTLQVYLYTLYEAYENSFNDQTLYKMERN